MEGMESATETSIMFAMFIYASILGPITEEIVFRGALLRGLEKYGKLFAIIVSAVLFGAFHSNLIQGIFTTLAGLLLGYVAIEYSIKWAIVFHIINNLVLGDILGSILSYFSLGTQSIINYILLILAFFGGIFVLFKSWGSIKKYIRENKSDRTVFCKTFLHNIAKKKYTPLRLKFFSDYFGLDRAFLSRKLSPVKLKMCA